MSVRFTLLPPRNLTPDPEDPPEYLQWQCDVCTVEGFQSDSAMLAHAMKAHNDNVIEFFQDNVLNLYNPEDGYTPDV